MLLSMTGFGKAVTHADGKKITAEIKSLNSKQMDLNVRLSQQFRSAELDLRQMVASRLERGKADLVVSVENEAGDTPVRLNVKMLQAYKSQIEAVSDTLGIARPADWYSVLLRLPEVMQTDDEAEISDNELDALRKAVEQACDGLMEHRRSEGKRLEEFFTIRINRIAQLLKEVEPHEHERVEHIREKITDGLQRISAVEYDKGRLEQEMIFYIEKLDVSEEKQRLAQHLAYFVETMQGTAGQGKKLGFIAQEMGREINTLGSKSNNAPMQRLVVMMKDELEQIKEQVLNVM